MLWKASALVDFLRLQLSGGFALFITDRGRQMVVRDAFTFGEILAKDYVSIANAENRPLDIPGFLQEKI